jgi:hypothetical protein
MSDQNESKPAPTLGPDIRAAVGRQLRVIYADIVAEGVPEHFAEILRRLDEPDQWGLKKRPDTSCGLLADFAERWRDSHNTLPVPPITPPAGVLTPQDTMLRRNGGPIHKNGRLCVADLAHRRRVHDVEPKFDPVERLGPTRLTMEPADLSASDFHKKFLRGRVKVPEKRGT